MLLCADGGGGSLGSLFLCAEMNCEFPDDIGARVLGPSVYDALDGNRLFTDLLREKLSFLA